MSRVIRKPTFCICENKGADHFTVIAKLVSTFVLATQIVQFLYFQTPKFPASSRLLGTTLLVFSFVGAVLVARQIATEAELLMNAVQVSVIFVFRAVEWRVDMKYQEDTHLQEM